MKKIFITTIGILLLSLSGVSYASVLDDYGNIKGTAKITGPTFYIGSATDKTLLINKKSPDCSHFSLKNSNTRIFKTEEIKKVDFDYNLKVNFSVRAEVNTTTPQNLTLRFGYYNDEDDDKHFCSEATNVKVDNTSNDYTASVKCGSKPKNVKRFFYEFKGNCDNCKYTISKCHTKNNKKIYTSVSLDK